MTAKPAKSKKSAKSAAVAGLTPAAGNRTAAATSVPAVNPDAEADKTFFRVRITGNAAFDTLGTPADPLPPAADAPGTGEPGLLGRLLGGVSSRPPRPPRRRTPPPVQAVTPEKGTEGGGDAPALQPEVIEPEQDAAGPDDAVDSYRSASDLTAPEDTKQSDVVA